MSKLLPAKSYLVPHQSNLRMLEAMVAYSQLDPLRVYFDGIRTIGNTSAPATFLGLEDALKRGLVDPSNDVMLGAFGAELQVGAAWLRPLNPTGALARRGRKITHSAGTHAHQRR